MANLKDGGMYKSLCPLALSGVPLPLSGVKGERLFHGRCSAHLILPRGHNPAPWNHAEQGQVIHPV